MKVSDVRRVVFKLLLALFAALACQSELAAQTDVSAWSMIGLREMGVLVENFDHELEERGLRKADVKADAELRLKAAGITVLSTDSPGVAYLYINVLALGDSGLYAVSSVRL